MAIQLIQYWSVVVVSATAYDRCYLVPLYSQFSYAYFLVDAIKPVLLIKLKYLHES